MSLCMKEMTPIPDARRPFRNQERKAWRDGGDGRESAPAQTLLPKPLSPDGQTEGLVVIPPPILLQTPTMTWCPPTLSPKPSLASTSEPLFPKICNTECSRQCAESGGRSRAKTAEPKSEDRTPRGHVSQPPPRELPPHFFLRPPGTNCSPPAIHIHSSPRRGTNGLVGLQAPTPTSSFI